MNIRPNGENYWKWIATTGAIWTGTVLALGGGWYTYALRQPSQEDLAQLQAQVDEIEERQQLVLQHLVGIDAQLANQEMEIEQLRRVLEAHVAGE